MTEEREPQERKFEFVFAEFGHPSFGLESSFAKGSDRQNMTRK